MKTNSINKESSFDIHLLELVRLRIGYLNECHYSIDVHFNELKNFGETDIRLSLVSVWDQVHYFSDKECALFYLTDYIIDSNNKYSLQKVKKLLKPHFNKDQITKLIQAIKQIDFWTRSMKHFEAAAICKKNADN